MARQTYPLTCCLLLTAACGPMSEADFEEIESTSSPLRAIATDDYYFDSCPDCSKNAATVGDGVVFDELNMDGSNGKGITVIEQKLCTTPIEDAGDVCPEWEQASVSVPSNRLVARRLVGSDWVDVDAADLVGRLVITIQSDCQAKYDLLVQKAAPADYWTRMPEPRPDDYNARKADYEELPEYEIGYLKFGGCTGEPFLERGRIGAPMPFGGSTPPTRGPGGGNGTPTTPDRMVPPSPFPPVCEVEDAIVGERARLAIVHSGDKINSALKRVTSRNSSRWFNLACNGTALAKLHFLRHTRRVGGPDQTTSDRMTILKMLTADYCGTGTSYTEDGHPLRYWDGLHGLGRSTFPTLTDTERDQVEAMWGPNGALCLNTPRHVQRLEVPCAREPDGLPFCDEDEMAIHLAKRHAVVSAHAKPKLLRIPRVPVERRVAVAP